MQATNFHVTFLEYLFVTHRKREREGERGRGGERKRGKISQNSDRYRNYMQPGCIFNHRSEIKAKDFGNELEMEMNTLHQFDMHGRAREKTEEENNN